MGKAKVSMGEILDNPQNAAIVDAETPLEIKVEGEVAKGEVQDLGDDIAPTDGPERSITDDEEFVVPKVDEGDENDAEPEKEAQTPDAEAAKRTEAADLYARWEETFARDPEAMIAAMVEEANKTLPANRRIALASAEATAPITTGQYEDGSPWETDPKDWTPFTPIEADYMKQRELVARVPEMHQAMTQFGDAMLDILIENAVLAEQVRAVAELNGLEISPADCASIRAQLDGKITLEAAVKKVYAPKLIEKAEEARQARRPRPRTQGQGGGETITVKRGARMAEIMRSLPG